MPVVIGTSGWQYRDWRGRFYPPKLPQRLWLEHHAAAFATTEVNNSFYRLPDREVFEQWRARTPADYVVTVKASRFLTHIKRLKEPEEPVARLMDRAAGLGDKLGPVLVQLPPNLQVDVDSLDRCLAAFPRTVRVAVEPRHDTWWTDEVRQVLQRYDAALSWSDRRGRSLTPLWRTASWGYVRLHEGDIAPWPNYTRAELAVWARRVAETFADADDVFVYFNNDPGRAAIRNAVTFGHEMATRGRAVTRVPAAGRYDDALVGPPA